MAIATSLSPQLALPSGEGFRPPLKWAGGKRWLVPHLRPLFEKHRHRRLVEPFCGGLAVTLGLIPDDALLNDINPHAINFYRQVRKGLRVNIDMMNERELFFALRDEFNALILSGKAATAQNKLHRRPHQSARSACH